MGYKGDVLIRIKCRDTGAFELCLAELLMLDPEWLKHIRENSTDFDEFEFSKDGITIVVKGWKWYDDYSLVEACEKLYKYFEGIGDKEDLLDGVFLRIGEDTNDNDERYINNGYDLGYIDRSLSY